MVSWQSSAVEVTKVLGDQNPWHRDGEVPRVLAPPVERALTQRLWNLVLSDRPHRFHLILGPRRVGKTTAMFQTVRHLIDAGIEPERLWWLRMDHPILMRESLGDLVKHVIEMTDAEDGKEVVLLLDELVYAQNWDLWLKTFYDDRWPVRVVATSSATAALRGGRVESGVGRWTEHFLMPYLFSEYLDLNQHDVELEVGATLAETLRALPSRPTQLDRFRRRFLLVGGFPELIVTDRDGDPETDEDRLLVSQRVLRTDAVERALYKDIPQSFSRIDNPMLLERLLYLLADQVTGVLSPSSIGQSLDNLSQPTFDRYVGYLEQTFLVFRLTNYSASEGTVQRRGRKIYFHDGAVRNSALQRGLAPLTDPTEMGLLIENLAAATLNTLGLHTTGVRVHHWRDGRSEVDLIFDQHDAPLAFEVGSSSRHSRAGLSAFQRKHKRFSGNCYLVTPDGVVQHPDTSNDGIGSLPLDVFLLAAGKQAEQALRVTMGS